MLEQLSFVIAALVVLTYLDKILGVSLSGIFREIGNLATSFKSRESVNALIVISILSLIVVFFGSYAVRELADVIGLLRAGASEAQAAYIRVFSGVTVGLT